MHTQNMTYIFKISFYISCGALLQLRGFTSAAGLYFISIVVYSDSAKRKTHSCTIAASTIHPSKYIHQTR